MSNTPVTIELNQIPLETIRSLFCLDMPDVYQPGFPFEATFTPHQMVTSILKSISLDKMADEFDKAGQNPIESNYSTGCITTWNGSCFAYARYKNEKGVYHLTFLSAIITQELSLQQKPIFNIDQQSILTGIENEDAGQQYFDPVACLCRSIIDDDMNDELIEPQDANDFYASLCYMQQSMAACISGNEFDLLKNQCWFDPIIRERAFIEFSNLVGLHSVEEVIQRYHDHNTMIDGLLAQIEDDDDDTPTYYPQLTPLLN